MEQEGRFLNVEDASLYVYTYAADSSLPDLLFIKGFGASEGSDHITDNLSNHFSITSYSPRQNGRSNGEFALDTLVKDTAIIADNLAQRKGSAPYILGQSLGAYVGVRIIEEGAPVDSAVLISPLRYPFEHFPEKLLGVLPKVAKTLDFLSLQPPYGGQKLPRRGHTQIIREMDNAPRIERVPEEVKRVIIPGYSEIGLELDVREEAEFWRSNGAAVDLLPEEFHWLSDKRIKEHADCFSRMGKLGLYEKIIRDFNRS